VTQRWGPGRGSLFLFFFGLAFASAAGLAASCLPDLETTNEPRPTKPSSGVCGDGIIDLDAGEQCDPGVRDASIPGCTSDCKLDCDAGNLPAYIDPSSNHCYFLLSLEAGTREAGNGCQAFGAHVITIGDPSEQEAVSGNLTPTPKTTEFWLDLGKNPHDGGPQTYSAVTDEPGLARNNVCRGCYGPVSPVEGGVLLPDPTHPGGDNRCVTWILGGGARWYATDCEASFPTICEREPPGSRRYDCSGGLCFTVQADPASPATHYLYDPTPMTDVQAAALCAKLNDPEAGTKATLVLFHNQEQREQVFYELLQLPPALGTPTDFWIGYTSTTNTKGALEWVWDNGGREYPSQWGSLEPTATLSGVRAFSSQSSKSYGTPGTTYDTQLAHAHDPPEGGADGGDGGDAGVDLHAVLCQLTE
jgi:Lectin C-type domain